jgi:hypothetical protein
VGRRHYRIVVEGEIGPRYAATLEETEVCVAHGKPRIIGPIVDQWQLHGLLARIEDLGLTLRSITPLNSVT